MKLSKILTILSIASLIVGCGKERKHTTIEADLPTIDVKLAYSEVCDISLTESVPGTVCSVNKAVIAAKVTGQIVNIPVNLGQKVKKGDLLVSIAAHEINSKLQQAQTSLEKAIRDLKREESLLLQGASPPEMVRDLENQVRISKAIAEEAQAMLSYTRIVAPFDGNITRKHANEGDMATLGKPLLEIENPRKLRVEADVPEALSRSVKLLKNLDIEIPSLNLRMTGTIAEIAPSMDPVSRTFLVKVDLDKNDETRPGQFAKIVIPYSTTKAILVPRDAVSNWGQIERVFVVEKNTAQLRIVKTGDVHGDFIEILSGITGGEAVVVSKNKSSLRNGQPVKF